MTGDVARWVVIFGCAGSLGFMAALYQKVGKLVIPSAWIRCLVVSNIGFMLILALGLHSRLGYPLTWRTPAFGVFVMMQLVGEAGIYWWYGTEAGREHMQKMQETRGGP